MSSSSLLWHTSFDIACSIWNMCKIRHNFAWCISSCLLAWHMELFWHFFKLSAHLRLQLRGNRLSVLVRLRLHKGPSCSRTCTPRHADLTHGTLFIVFCPQATLQSCCARTFYHTTARGPYAHCAWNATFMLCDYPAPLSEGVENRTGKYKNCNFVLITRVLPHILRLLLFSVIYFHSLHNLSHPVCL